MADYGQAGALSYEIPQHFLGSSPQQDGIEPSQQGIANQGAYQQDAGHQLLAEREHLTDNYYNNYGVLDSYAKDMAKKGINVFEPDYSQSGGGEAFKTFQRMQANVMHGANALKVEMEAEKETRKLEGEGKARMEPGAKREGLYYSKPENFYSTAVAPGVLESNKLLGDQFGTQGEASAANKQVRDYQLHHLQEVKKKLAAEGKSTTEIDNDIHALLTATNVNPTLAAAWARASARSTGSSYSSDLYKKVYNEGASNWVPGERGEKISEDGVHIVNKSPSGDAYGYYDFTNPKTKKVEPIKMVIDHLYKDVDNPSKTFIKFKDDNIPDEEIDNPSVYARKIFRFNENKYGDISKIMTQLDREGKLDEQTGDVNHALLANPQDLTDQINSGRKKNQLYKRRQGELKKEITSLDTGTFGIGRSYKDFDTSEGVVRVGKNSNGSFYIKNSGPYKKTIDNLNWSQLHKELVSHDVYDDILTDETPEVKKPAPHGDKVVQNGVKFKWNGQEYVPE